MQEQTTSMKTRNEDQDSNHKDHKHEDPKHEEYNQENWKHHQQDLHTTTVQYRPPP